MILNEWWSRRGGGREVVSLAVPMIISSGSIALMQFTDRVFLTWYNPSAMGAAFSSAHVLWIYCAFFFSVAGYTNAFVSQYNGAKQYDRIAPIVWQGFFLGMAVMPFLMLLAPLNPYVFQFFGHSPELAQMETLYLYYLLWGVGPFVANEAVISFFSGQKKMATVMYVNILFVMVNVLLDYFLIFGFQGYFAWGLAGAAIATSIAQWLRLATFLLLMFWEDRRTKLFHVWESCRFHWKTFSQLWKYGSMSGIQFVVEMISFSSCVLLIGKVGIRENTATAIAFNLNMLSFLPILGIGVAVISLVGNYLGANEPKLARRATMTALTLSCLVTSFFVGLYLFFPDQLLAPYSRANPEEFAALRDMTIVLLRFIAFYLFFDTINIIFCSAIKGAGDTRFVMLTACVTGPLFVLVLWLGLHYFGGGLYWCWIALTAWIFTLCVIYLVRFFKGKWMNMRLTDQIASKKGGSP